MLVQWIVAVALVLAAGAYLIRRSIRQRREGAVCDRCAAAAHVRMANRSRTGTPATETPKKA